MSPGKSLAMVEAFITLFCVIAGEQVGEPFADHFWTPSFDSTQIFAEPLSNM
jgi:hypothetical protein